MSWEYRVMVHDGEHAIYEVYYDDEDGRVKGYTAVPKFPTGETLEELRSNCQLYLAALDKSVLPHDDP